jgi:hypothetical protein
MTFRIIGWAALGLFGAANVPFWLRMMLLIPARGNAYAWANLAFMVLGVLTIILSVVFFEGCLLYAMRAWRSGPRWSVSLLASTLLLVGASFCFVIACVGMNFMGQ